MLDRIGEVAEIIDSAVLLWYNGVNLEHRCTDPAAAPLNNEVVML